MKKVLILAYDFPPYVSVGGLRPYSWYKYFHEFGIYPIVITRQWGNEFGNHLDYIAESESDEIIREISEKGKIIRTPYKPNWSNRMLMKHGKNSYTLPRKIATAYYEFAQFLHPTGPKVELYKAARECLKNNKVDIILTTGDPFILFSYASKLAKEFNTPWMADYRDPWSQNKYYQRNKLYFLWNYYMEKKIVATSSTIITVSEFLKIKLNRYFPSKKIEVLPNGYDPEVIDKISQIPQQTNKLTISFVGTVYVWHPWRSVIKVVSDFLESNDTHEIKLNFYGINISEEVKDYIQQFPEKTINSIEIFPKIPNLELLKNLGRENVMLLFNYYSYMGTKIFDYIGTKRKIILCYSQDSEALEIKEKHYNIEEIEGVSNQLQADLIQETESGVIVKDAKHLQEVLNELHAEFQETGQIACHSKGVENCSRKIQVEKLAEIIKNIV
jgi:glycosyltransferase involved in cell wall biosynthesis